MKSPAEIINLLRNITFWKTIRVVAIITLISVIYSVASDAYSLNRAFVWIKDRILELTWKAPANESDHYLLEISKTNLLAEPVTTYLSHAYTNNANYQIELQDDHSYIFRVQAVSDFGVLSDFSDSTSLFIYDGGEVAKKTLSTDATPVEFSLSQNYPNPFNSQTTIEYQISGSGTKVNLAIYNILGQRVKELVNKNQPPGKYYMIWNGRDEDGRNVASGNYIYQIIAGKFRTSKKMIYLK